MKSEKPVPITGVWLRTGHGGRLEVLVEVDGTWRLLLEGNGARYRDGEISHIWEPLGILRAPVDSL